MFKLIRVCYFKQNACDSIVVLFGLGIRYLEKVFRKCESSSMWAVIIGGPQRNKYLYEIKFLSITIHVLLVYILIGWLVVVCSIGTFSLNHSIDVDGSK